MTGKIGRKELAIIHIAKAQCGWSDDEYRHVLKDGFGVASSKELTSKQADRLIALFQAEGFRVVSRTKAVDKQPVTGGNWERLPMMRKVAAILGDLGKTDAYADGIARRMFKVDAWRWCGPEQLRKIVAALEYTRNKMAGKGPAKSRKRMGRESTDAPQAQQANEGD